MSYRVMKFLHGVARLSMLGLLGYLIVSGFDWGFSLGCLFVSAVWFALTWISSRHYLKSYANVASRLGVLVPVWLGLVLSALAIANSPNCAVTVLGALSVVAWGALYARYRANRRLFKKLGHGPVPVGAAVSPDIHNIRVGDLIVTGGGAMDMAGLTEAAVAHAELVVGIDDDPQSATYGQPLCLSSYMRSRAVLNPLSKIVHIYRTRGHFLVLRPAQPLTEVQLGALWQVAKIMLRQNDRYIALKSARRARRLKHLPASVQKLLKFLWRLPPEQLRAMVRPFVQCNGYDWKGLLIGTRAPDHWTCVGACTEAYMRIGVPLKPYGVGLLGLGTGWLDPIQPVRFLYDPAMRVLSQEECGGCHCEVGDCHPTLVQYAAGPILPVTDLLGSLRRRVVRVARKLRRRH